MPQLDTVYIFFTFIWTWSTLYLMMKKMKTFKIISTPKKMEPTKKNLTLTLPWT